MKHVTSLMATAILFMAVSANSFPNRETKEIKGQVENIQTHMYDGISADVRDSDDRVQTFHICPYQQPVLVDMSLYVFQRLQKAEAESAGGCKAKTVTIQYNERRDPATGRNKLCIVQVNY
jgi:hypothetical protein